MTCQNKYKWIKALNTIICQNIKILDRKIAKYLSDLWIEKPFLRLQSIEEIIKENIELTT